SLKERGLRCGVLGRASIGTSAARFKRPIMVRPEGTVQHIVYLEPIPASHCLAPVGGEWECAVENAELVRCLDGGVARLYRNGHPRHWRIPDRRRTGGSDRAPAPPLTTATCRCRSRCVGTAQFASPTDWQSAPRIRRRINVHPR